jgi:hypothetical protein
MYVKENPERIEGEVESKGEMKMAGGDTDSCGMLPLGPS